VIGIVGPGFNVEEFGPAPEVWARFQLDPESADQGHYFSAAGQLKQGVNLQQARAQLQVSAEAYRRKFRTRFSLTTVSPSLLFRKLSLPAFVPSCG
jgi:hypothetical protein